MDWAGAAAEGYQTRKKKKEDWCWTNVGTSKLRWMTFNPRRQPANINPCEEERGGDCVSATLNVITVNQPAFIDEGRERWIIWLEISADWIERDEEKGGDEKEQEEEEQRWGGGSRPVYDRGRGGEEWWGLLKSTHTPVPSGTSYLLLGVARRPEPNANATAADVLISTECFEVGEAFLHAARVARAVFR